MDSAPLAENAPAKINLALHITGRRADGFHTLESLVVFTAFGDRIEAQAAEADSFEIDGPFGGSLCGQSGNLVTRARDALREAVGGRLREGLHSTLLPVSIHLEKHLPIASGIGGGSSDAAATLKVLNHLWRCGLAPDTLAGIGSRLGADVPMCLHAAPLIARGIGEIVGSVSDLPELHLVLVNAGVEVSTPSVFAALAQKENQPLPPLPPRLAFEPLRNWLAISRNDLEAPATAIAPAIAESLDALRASQAAFARMSGSGATCFGLYETQAQAQSAAAAIRHSRPGWFVAASNTKR
ncbi:4-(cytidine 5'-diphospho)-2-C-methyl-D-erythritol kinase [Pseudaminobacter arsenicus]|uniref:4-diphosphocytidyl-2-C-methyl-D-erythritol kinase n=1 Tax=Borborobacter arsenicus TaxID=1851146 RepID=A0A432V530_9HYPH|nr:4-(cytidine 5'-diphospho)-2-C-methyl-D-erythritol kinase [Pseudaminobacter arsenicus]RUM97265.1 4-(cytidine 5'-diphospho)-2-C-methyl-D-erythritol kinase [Pseudaminobacter arsenicus]